MSMDEVKRKTDRVDEMIGELVAGPDADLAVVGKAVRDVNETLAVHAAWTEERFEAVLDRLVSLARVLVMTSSKIEMHIAGIDSRLPGLAVSLSGIAQTLSNLEQDQAVLLQRDMAMLQKFERLEQSQEALQHGLTMYAETVQSLTTRVGEVLADAISDEIDQHMTDQRQRAGLIRPDCGLSSQ